MWFWEIYRFKKRYVHGYITFFEGDRVVLVHRDSKYEHTFACKCVRGIIMFPYNIFEKLELLTDDHAKYFKEIT